MILLLSLLGVKASEATVVRVPEDQPTLQAGIDAAQAGDTVDVAPGTYLLPGQDQQWGRFGVVLNKAVTLRSRKLYQAILDGGSDKQNNIVKMQAAGHIEGFVLQNAGTGIIQIEAPTATWTARNLIVRNMALVGLSINDINGKNGTGIVSNILVDNAHVGFGTNDARGFDIRNSVVMNSFIAFQSFDNQFFRVSHSLVYNVAWGTTYGAASDLSLNTPPIAFGEGMVVADPRPLTVTAGALSLPYFPHCGSPVADAGDPSATDNDVEFPPSMGGARGDIGPYGGPGAALTLATFERDTITTTACLPYNPPVIASAVASPWGAPAPTTVTFTGSATDADESLAPVDWDWNGDRMVDETTPTLNTTHVYAAPFNFSAVARITDGAGTSVYKHVRVFVDQPTPTPTPTPMPTPIAVRISPGVLSNPAALVHIRVIGPGTDAGSVGQDLNLTLGPGTYQILTTAMAGSYGTFTVSGGAISGAAGAVTFSGNVVSFDLSQLASIRVHVTTLGNPATAASAILAVSGVTNRLGGAPVIYLPPSASGSQYEVFTRGMHGSFGTFSVGPDLAVTATGGALVRVADGIDFDRAKLAAVRMPVSRLWAPAGAARLFIGVDEATLVLADATIYLPPTLPGAPKYSIFTRAGMGFFGSFIVDNDLEITSTTGALVAAADGSGIDFDLSRLAAVRFPLSDLVVPTPVSGTIANVGIAEVGNVFKDATVYLPPSFSTATYLLAASGTNGQFGRLTVASDGRVTATGALRVDAAGHGITFAACELAHLRVSPAPGQSWRVANGIYTPMFDTEKTLLLPDGTYPIQVANGGGELLVTLVSGSITQQDPAAGLPGVSVSIRSCDTTPPVLSVPAAVAAEATSAAGASVTYSVTAIDAIDGPVTATCAPPSGGMFPMGGTDVACTATDAAGNTGTGGFTVTVSDTTPPALSVPADVVVTATAPSGAAATYSVSATDLVDPAPSVSCSPPSGSTFAAGTTTVTCSAADAAGNSAASTFRVQVVYRFSGFLPPIATDGSSIFRSGRTVPAKFQLSVAGGALVTTAAATIQVFMITDAVLGSREEVTPDAAGQSNTNDLFRFEGDQYVYDLKTTGYAVGTYLLRAVVSDGTTHDVRVSVR